MKQYTLDDFTKLSAIRDKVRDEYFKVSTELGKLLILDKRTAFESRQAYFLTLIRSSIISEVTSLGFSIDWLEMTEDEFSEAITKQMEVIP